MNSPLVVDLFVEDQAHEEFLKALVWRLARDERQMVRLHVRSARGGHGKVLDELSLYQTSVLHGIGGLRLPDLVCVAIDANCSRFAGAVKSVRSRLRDDFQQRSIIACPDPHIERWYLADPDSFAEVVGIRPKVGKKKCERDLYKQMLSRSVSDAGHPATLGGIEFARELVEAMDLYRAGKNERSLKHFVDDARNRLRVT